MRSGSRYEEKFFHQGWLTPFETPMEFPAAPREDAYARGWAFDVRFQPATGISLMKAGMDANLNLMLQELGLDVGGWFGGRNYLGATADVAIVFDFGNDTRSASGFFRLRGGVEGRRLIGTGIGSACTEYDDCRDVTTRSWLGLAAGIEDQRLAERTVPGSS